ncbi:MAG: SRPBCC family protein [Nitrososphaerota archaeon]|nr:SRPBCC family protein [Nitrososphaerota archaeon]
MRFEVSLVVRTSRNRAYAAYTDFEAMPKWSKQMRAVTVTRNEGGRVTIGITMASGKRASRDIRLVTPARVESDGETRFTLAKSTVEFEETTGGTRVTALLEVRFKGHWGWILKTRGKMEAEASAMEELEAFAKYAESTL